MKGLRLRINLEAGEDGWIVATVPGLPGCVSQGKTRKSALKNVKEAVLGYFESYIKHKEFIPFELDIQDRVKHAHFS